jgi:hypothetical protein
MNYWQFQGLCLSLDVATTVFVAIAMWRNGRLFLADAFGENLRLARSVNQSLLLAFSLIIVGEIALANGPWGGGDASDSSNRLFQFLLAKIGWQLVMQGLLYLVNLFLLSRIRMGTRSRAKEARNGESILA